MVGLIKQTITDFGKHRAPQLAAALSYYTIFSVAPLLIIAIAVAGLVFGQAAVQNQVIGQISGLVGPDAANLIQSMIQNASKPGAGVLATIIGIVALLAGAAGVFGQIKTSLNTIWDVQTPPGPGGIKGILRSLRSQLLSFGMVLGTGFLLLVSLILSAALSAVSQFVGNQVALPAAVWELVNFALSFFVITLLFAAIYKVLPDTQIDWRDVWIGAAVTALLFVIGKWLIGLYLGHASVASAYGAAGALVVLLVWIYYSADILFLGAEFTQVYARKHGTLRTAAPATASSHKTMAPLPLPNGQISAAAMSKRPARKRDTTGTIERLVRILSPLLIVVARIVIMVDQARTAKKQEKPRASTRQGHS